LGALVATADRRNMRNVVPAAIRMLQRLSERGSDFFGLATSDHVYCSDSLGQLSNKQMHSPVVVGYGLKRIFPKDIPQPIASNELRLAFEGRIYPTSGASDCDRALSWIKENTSVGLRTFVREVDGSYAVATLEDGRLSIARDPLGCKPLYLGEKEGIVAFASERKALWAIAVDSPISLLPGAVETISEGTVSMHQPDVSEPSACEETDLDSAARRLSELLVESIRNRAGDSRRVAVAYSGGVDSAVVASSSRLAGLDVELFTVTMRDNGELEHAEKSAEALGLRLVAKKYSPSDLRQVIRKVLWRIEKPDVMNLAIAVPMFWAAQLAEENGFQLIFAGQGADELFGGYDRYIAAYHREGPEEASRLMTRDIQNLSGSSFERDEQATSGSRVELRLPFANLDLVRYVQSLPLDLKIGGVEEALQKHVLRRVAQLQGIPRFISEKPKRALQYTTGVEAAIRLVAGQESLAPHEYVSRFYEQVRRDQHDMA